MEKIVGSICQMCGTTYSGCGIDVHVKDNKIIKIEGTKGHPVNNGRLCAKAFAAMQLQDDPIRLKYPLKKVGGKGNDKWVRISWDEAFDIIVDKLTDIIKTNGPQSIGWLKGQAPGWESNWDWCQRFMNAIGSPNIATPGHNCHIARRIAHYNTYGWMPDPDYENTKCILFWGYNPFNTSMSQAGSRIMRAKQRGVKLIVVDPRFSRTASKADIYVQLRPGTDGALALSMINVIIKENLYDKEFIDKWTYGFDKLVSWVKEYTPEWAEEITWVPADTIRQVARMYATTKPAAMWDGNGMDQRPNVVQAVRAICILTTITGNLDVPGGNVFDPCAAEFAKIKPMGLRNMTNESIIKEFKKSVSKHLLKFRLEYCTLPEILDTIFTEKPYPLKALIVQGMNPAIIGSNTKRVREALKKIPFLVVFDLFKTATAEMADLVLPAASFLERTLLVTRPKPRVDFQYFYIARKVIEPLGESKSDFDFISELTRRMGHEEDFPWKRVEDAIDYQLEPIGLSYEKLYNNPEPVVALQHTPENLYQKYEQFFSRMPTKKVELYSTKFDELGYDPLPTYVEPGESPVSNPELAEDYPLICMSGLKPGLYTHTQFRHLPWLKEIMPDPWVEIHPEEAEKLDIKDGDTVTMSSLKGSIEITCKVINTTDPRMVALTHGWGDPYTGSQPVTNTLTPHEIRCPISDATSNRTFLVNIQKGS